MEFCDGCVIGGGFGYRVDSLVYGIGVSRMKRTDDQTRSRMLRVIRSEPGLPKHRIAERFGIGRTTVYRILAAERRAKQRIRLINNEYNDVIEDDGFELILNFKVPANRQMSPSEVKNRIKSMFKNLMFEESYG
jgi:hypothetical protein